jgi:hypothetical protein
MDVGSLLNRDNPPFTVELFKSWACSNRPSRIARSTAYRPSSSRKVAEDLSDRRRVEEMERRVRELIEQIAANRREFAEFMARTRAA